MTTVHRWTVLRSDDPRAANLLAAGWRIAHRSWGARLELTPSVIEDLQHLSASVEVPRVLVRELVGTDVQAALALDHLTLHDYPGGIATAHAPMTPDTARPTSNRPAWGAFEWDDRLVAMTWARLVGPVELDAEIDFTVVHPEHRGLGLARALKAATLLGLAARGITTVRTGGAEENDAMRRINAGLGFVVDEEWWTLTPHP